MHESENGGVGNRDMGILNVQSLETSGGCVPGVVNKIKVNNRLIEIPLISS